MWTEAGSEFGSEKGYVFQVVRALYGMKSSGAAWITNLVETLNSMGYRSTEFEPDVWIKMATAENSTAYYKNMLVYVNDVLHLEKEAQENMLKHHQVYWLKEGFGPPDRYIGEKFGKVQLMDVRTISSISCVEYLRGAIKNIYFVLEGNKSVLKSYGDGNCPYSSSYRPKLDVTNELYAELINKFQQLIGILRC